MKLNFLVIGAQKSATTALFKYLQGHPSLALPDAKELPLFTNNHSPLTASSFINQHYKDQSGKLLGKVTPQYMCDEAIPGRIFHHNPEIKLIAVLRDPIDRAWSHYRMNKRRETEDREFEQAMLDSLEPETLHRGRAGSPPMHQTCFESEADCYLPWGEYGRILGKYLEFFDREQMLVLYTSDLQHRPEQTLDRILTFLGLDAGYRPGCLGEVIHKGGSERLVSMDTLRSFRDLWPVNQVWESLPDAKKGVIRYWFEQKNVKAADEEMCLSEATVKRLKAHFSSDAKRLAELTGTWPTWA